MTNNSVTDNSVCVQKCKILLKDIDNQLKNYQYVNNLDIVYYQPPFVLLPPQLWDNLMNRFDK